MIENNEYIIKRSEYKNIEELPAILGKKANGYLLRWHISKVLEQEIVVEATLSHEGEKAFGLDAPACAYGGKAVVLSVIPTGVGCEIGGYAADAAPATALLASCSDYLITNPNAVNASNFISMDDNVWYTEGYTIDLFCKGQVCLYKPYSNRLGLIVEKADRKTLEVLYNIVNTIRAVYGVNIEEVVVTKESIGGRCARHQSGAYVGLLDDPSVLFEAAEYLIGKGINAIGITSQIHDLPIDDYARHFEGLHPNPLGGAEAVLSHLITKRYRIPAAHAPMTNLKEMPLGDNIVDARGAGEFASYSGLACILVGLSKAPQLEMTNTFRTRDAVNINNLLAVVAPAGAMGGIPMLFAQKFNIPIIAVKENRTILDVTGEKLNLKNLYTVNSYAEAAGYIMALRKGIHIESLHRPLKTLRM